MKIVLTCCAGMSTSMLMEIMKQECKKQNKDYQIVTVDSGVVDKEADSCDIILLGPQVRHMLKRIQKLVSNKKPVALIKEKDYGQMDGAAVLKHAETLVKNFKNQ